jgi:hypothetical protein
MTSPSVTETATVTVDGPSRSERIDVLAIEEPLEIRVAWDGPRPTSKSLVITVRKRL